MLFHLFKLGFKTVFFRKEKYKITKKWCTGLLNAVL